MKNAGIELINNGTNWVLNILLSETASITELIITDKQAEELKENGVPVNK